MKESIKLTGKLLRRTLSLLIPLLLCYALTVAFPLIEKKGSDPFGWTEDALLLGLFWFLLLAMTVYEFGEVCRRSGSQEILAGTGQADRKLSSAFCLRLCLHATLMYMIVIGIFHGTFRSWSLEGTRMYAQIVAAGLLYGYLLALLGILTGCCLIGDSRGKAYCFIFLMAVVISPVSQENLPNSAAGYFLPGILEWIGLTAPDTATLDSLYGIPLEFPRWNLILLWISAFSLYRLCRSGNLRQRKIKIIFASALVVGLFVLYTQRANWYVLNFSSAKSQMNSDGVFYADWQGEETPADFTVSRYELSLSCKGRLRAEAVLTLNKGDKSDGLYRFTLNHGLQVREITDPQGNDLPFEREGDFLDITVPQGTDTLKILYQGNLGKYFANRQGILLPAYAAYYPLAGHYDLWKDVESGGLIVPAQGMAEAEFFVTVDTRLPVYANLQAEQDRSFSGITDGVTLMGGFVEEVRYADIDYVVPQYASVKCRLSSKDILDYWEEICSLCGIKEEFASRCETLFVMPVCVKSFSGTLEQAVCLDDHLMYCDISSPNVAGIVDVLLENRLQSNINNDILIRQFTNYLNRTVTGPVEKPTEESLEILIPYVEGNGRSTGGEFSQAYREYYPALFEYQMVTLGKKQLYAEIYAYLTTEEPPTNSVAFLYHLDD